jgi:predicted RecB family endonuclease
MTAVTLELGEHTYSVAKLDVMRQFHVARRLAPAVWALARSAGAVLTSALPDGVPMTFTNVVAGLKGLEDGALMGAVVEAAGPLVDVFAHMSNADSQYIINECLSVCSRQVGDTGWQVAYVEGSGFMFHDMTLPEMMQLVFAAIRHNLGNFMPALATPK